MFYVCVGEREREKRETEIEREINEDCQNNLRTKFQIILSFFIKLDGIQVTRFMYCLSLHLFESF